MTATLDGFASVSEALADLLTDDDLPPINARPLLRMAARSIDSADALRLAGLRDEIHSRDVYASVFDSATLATECARVNRECYGHDVVGPLDIAGGHLVITDLRPELRRRGAEPLDPVLPDSQQWVP